MKRLVADTGPVLHLHEAGALHLLPLIGEIFLPPLVATEFASEDFELPKWAKVQALSSTAQERALECGAPDCAWWRSRGAGFGARIQSRLFSPMMRRRD